MKNSIIVLQSNSNTPFISFFNVIEETDKAIKVQNSTYQNKVGWLPKSALELLDDRHYKTFTFKLWFRKLNQGEAIKKAFQLLD